ncbi:MAG TPA: hypothetical protein VKC90_06425, partial [Chitinophagaceae bacterium]|nr:hypothetical protein [Chitinophagaceae bacterium]
EEIIIHVPEYMVTYFRSVFKKNIFRGQPHLQINIMNQNIRLMPPTTEINELKKMADALTMTTAHQKYCTPYHRSMYGTPLHKLSTWVSPENYKFKTWMEKEDLIVVSPDPHPRKEEVLQALRSIQGLKVQIIHDLTYIQYKETISRAKWALTFGEGLDGYFVEPVLSGAIAFAVYNQDFFTPDFEAFDTVYKSVDVLIIRIATDINIMNENQVYQLYQKKQFNLCAFYYSHKEYLDNIVAFYKKNYTYA